MDEVDRPLIGRGGLLTEMEAPYVAEAERLERFDSNGERRYDLVKLPHIGGGIINSIVNMSNSIIGAGTSVEDHLTQESSGYPMRLIGRDLYWVCFCCFH
jgi:hypothetical protein